MRTTRRERERALVEEIRLRDARAALAMECAWAWTPEADARLHDVTAELRERFGDPGPCRCARCAKRAA